MGLLVDTESVQRRLLPLGVHVTVLDREDHYEMLTHLVPGLALGMRTRRLARGTRTTDNKIRD